MYGDYDLPFELDNDQFSITAESSEDGFTYTRAIGDDILSKDILTDKATMNISPIEPLNLPMKLTSALLIEFEKGAVLKPQSKRRLFLTFPVELGVFLYGRKEEKTIDIFSLVKPKYTLYGDVSTGTICKYWKSEIHPGIPSVDNLYEGIIELVAINNSSEWVEVHKAVFNAYGMKIFYDEKLVAMRARMAIKAEDMSITDFISKPLRKGMKESFELYLREKLPLRGSRFIMEGGL
ncbi:MAG: DUF432 domain-containing protein [Thermoplasmata archaeon]